MSDSITPVSGSGGPVAPEHWTNPLRDPRDLRLPQPYRSGTWGPEEADEMLARDGRQWRMP